MATALAFQKATKRKAKLRAAVFSPSGGGKTMTALRMAAGILTYAKKLNGRIALIDTEWGSASKYSDRFDFDAVELTHDQSIEAYCVAIDVAAAAGYDVLIIDSLSHGWQDLLAQIDQLAKTKYHGNTWGAWSEGTPIQKRMIKAILSYPGHIIATMRSKTEWQTTTDSRGKITPTRVGLAPEEGKGIEYEFDLLVEMNTEHYATVIKDRTGKFQDKIIEKPGEEFGEALAAWLDEGAEALPYTPPPPEPARPAYCATCGGALGIGGSCDACSEAAQHQKKSAGGPQNGTGSSAGNGNGGSEIRFPYGANKDKRPQDLDDDALGREYRYWIGQVEKPDANPRFAAKNIAIRDACGAELKTRKTPFSQTTPSPDPTAPSPDEGTPDTVERLLAKVREVKEAKQLTSAKVVVVVRKTFGKALEECSAEELEALIGELQAI